MITRRQGREWALQALVFFDLNPPEDVDAALASFWERLAEEERSDIENAAVSAHVVLGATNAHDLAALGRMKEFAEVRARGAWKDRAALDAAIEPYLEHWSLYRLGSVERATLRLAFWELLNCRDIPPPIVMNEAVDLVKYFSDSKSGRFVNGILDRFAKNLPAPPEQTEETFSPGA